MVNTKLIKKEIINPTIPVLDERLFLDPGISGDTGGGCSNLVDLRDDSYVFVFTGRRGAGKTTSMTLTICRAAALYPGIRILANYPIEFYIRRYSNNHLEHYKAEELDWFKLLSFDKEYHHCLICIDEAPDVISHLASMTWKNRLLAIFVRQLRKNRNSLLLAAQDFNLIDKSMRWQTDIIVECQDAKKLYGNNKLERGEVLLLQFFDNSAVWTNKNTEQRINEMRKGSGDAPDHAWVMQMTCYPRVLWGDKEKGVNPVFDTYFIQDPWESLRKVDMHLSSISVGDKAGTGGDSKLPVNPTVLKAALEIIEQVNPTTEMLPQADFYKSLEPLTSRDKNNLGKLLNGTFNAGRQTDGSNKRCFVFNDFNFKGFREHVEAALSQTPVMDGGTNGK